jgi:ketosteroid isomerase-like protein
MLNVGANICFFDLVTPLQNTGSDASRKRVAEWLASFNGPIGFEVTNLNVTADDDSAFCHCLSHVNGKRLDGGHLDMWWRTTICLSKINNTWTIIHEHDSVPFDMKTGRSSIDLKP